MFFQKARRIKELEKALARSDETTNKIIEEAETDMQVRQNKAINALKERYAEDLMGKIEKVKAALKEEHDTKISALKEKHSAAISSLQGKLRDQSEADALLSAVHLVAEVARSRGMESRTDKEKIADLEKKLEENAKNWRIQAEAIRSGLGGLATQQQQHLQFGYPFGLLGESLGSPFGDAIKVADILPLEPGQVRPRIRWREP